MTKNKAWIKAIRLRSLPLTLSCILMGSVLAYFYGNFKPLVLVLATITTAILQIISNLANDLGDHLHGADHDERQGPSRTVQSGLISPMEMKKAIIWMVILGFSMGCALVYWSLPTWSQRLTLVAIGIAAILAAIGYTMGKKPYGYLGLGDLFVFIFFGWVGVLGTYYLHAEELNMLLLWPASSCSFLAVSVLNINNIRDIDSDRIAGKKTLALRLGSFWARVYHLFLLIMSLTCAIIFILHINDQWTSWLFLFSIPLILKNGIGVWNETEPEKIDPYLRQMAMTSVIFVALFATGLLLT